MRSSNAVNVCACANFTHTCLLGPSIWSVVTSFLSNSRWSYVYIREFQTSILWNFLYRKCIPPCLLAHTCSMFSSLKTKNVVSLDFLSRRRHVVCFFSLKCYINRQTITCRSFILFSLISTATSLGCLHQASSGGHRFTQRIKNGEASPNKQ